MSLINDALKRAKDAQQKSPLVAAGPQLRPAELAPRAKISRALGPAAPLVIILIVCSGLILLLMLPGHKPSDNPPADLKASARVNPVPETKPPILTAAASPPPAAAQPSVALSPVAPPVSSTLALLKLQAIFFAPGRSSAIISGKTVRVGDTVQGFRVAAISQSSATLVSATETNVMKLEVQ